MDHQYAQWNRNDCGNDCNGNQYLGEASRCVGRCIGSLLPLSQQMGLLVGLIHRNRKTGLDWDVLPLNPQWMVGACALTPCRLDAPLAVDVKSIAIPSLLC